MIHRRAEAASIKIQVGNHTFGATGITAYLKNKGTLENAQYLVDIDSTRSPDLANQRQFYVSSSRPRIELRIYTDNVQGKRRAVGRTQENELALDVVKQRRNEPRQEQHISRGMHF
jgi:hypothetical protein